VTYQEVRYQSNAEVVPPVADLNNNAWQIAITFLLTDDKASYNGVKPKNIFDPEKGNFGAFELAFRYNELSIDKNVFPIFANPLESASKARAWAAGFNWYFNQYFRFSINYESTRFESYSPELSFPDENIILTRLQVAF
jgi:phosphate-selective porin OprO/OprP